MPRYCHGFKSSVFFFPDTLYNILLFNIIGPSQKLVYLCYLIFKTHQGTIRCGQWIDDQKNTRVAITYKIFLVSSLDSRVSESKLHEPRAWSE